MAIRATPDEIEAFVARHATTPVKRTGRWEYRQAKGGRCVHGVTVSIKGG